MSSGFHEIRDSYPVMTVRFDLDTGLLNLMRFVPLDALLEAQKLLVTSPSIERLQNIILMLKTMRSGTGRRRAAHLFNDAIDARCWEVMEQGKIDVPRLVGIATDAGAGLFAGPFMVEFSTSVFMEACLGLPDLKAWTADGLPTVWVSVFQGNLIFAEQEEWPAIEDGHAGLFANRQPKEPWKSAIVYNQIDSRRPAIIANHYFSNAQETARAVLMQNSIGEYWAYISRDWEVPDGGNVMRVHPSHAADLIDLGLHVHPMLHDDPHQGYVKWDKSDVWVTDPVPPMPVDGMDTLKDLLTLMHSSDMIIDSDSWIVHVGKPLSHWGHLSKGHHHYRLGEHALAVEAFSEALIEYPDAAEAYYGRGGAHARLVALELAVQDFNKSIELNPTHFESYVKRAESYAALGEFASAIKDADNAISISPSKAVGYAVRWTTRVQIIELLRRSDGTDSAVLSHLMHDHILRILDDIDSAVRLGGDYEELYIDNSDVAQSASTQNTIALATKMLESIMVDPSNPRTASDYYYCGVRALYTNNRNRALQYFERAKELGFENLANVDQHINNLQTTTSLRPPL